MNRHFFSSLFGFGLLATTLHAADVSPLHDGWRLQSACKLQAAGDAISVAGFSTEGWIGATVPTTVLAAQVAAGIFPDPYFGDNLRRIPGASYPIGENFANLPMPADSPYRCGWWYRDAFTAPPAAGPGRRYWLHFGGITAHGREIELHLENRSPALAFQLDAAVRTESGDLIAPVFWSDNWIELVPGESRTLTVELPENAPPNPVVHIGGWNIQPVTVAPGPASRTSAKE